VRQQLTTVHRYKKDLNVVLNKILNDDYDFELKLIGGQSFKYNLTFTNNMRIIVNHHVQIIFAKGKDRMLIECNSKKLLRRGAQHILLTIGSPVQCVAKYQDVYNRQMFEVSAIDKTASTITLKDEDQEITVEAKLFHRYFRIAHAITVHSMQGSELNEAFGIYETEKFTQRMLYTSLSRATDLDLIHVNQKITETRRDTKPFIVELGKHIPVDYIYALVKDDKIKYIGHTTDTKIRLEQHQETKAQFMPFTMIKLRVCYFNVLEHEKNYIEKYQANELWNVQHNTPKPQPKQTERTIKKINVGSVYKDAKNNKFVCKYYDHLKNKEIKKSFSINKYGEVKAEQMAIEFKNSIL
jgi:predicted GIY-YIG superfamily endonuclease